MSGGRDPGNGRQAPDTIERALGRWEGTASRRDFLKTSGLFVFGLSAIGAAGAAREGLASQPRSPAPIRTPTFSSSTRGWSSTRTAARPSTSARPTGDRGPGPPPGR